LCSSSYVAQALKHYLIDEQEKYMANISIWQLVILMVIIILLFGTKKLKGFGSDLGGALKGFKKAMHEDEQQLENSEEKMAK